MKACGVNKKTIYLLKIKNLRKRLEVQRFPKPRTKIDVVKITDSLCLNDFREAAVRGKDSNSRDRERHRHDDTRRDRDERRRRERSPDRSTRRVRETSERHGENSHRSSRDREDDKWRKRPERDDDNRERMRNDSRTFLRPADIDSG